MIIRLGLLVPLFCLLSARGEKLYVTKDKRDVPNGRRCLCWGVGLLLLVVAVLIAVLAGSKCNQKISNGHECLCFVLYIFTFFITIPET